MKQLVLIDGKNFCYRVHYTHKDLASRGRPTSVLYGGLRTLVKMKKHLPEASFVFCWDGKPPTWRHLYAPEAYKSNRNADNPETRKVHQQLDPFGQALGYLGIPQFKVDGLECDDLIGVMATTAHDYAEEIVIISNDRDFFQLMNDKIKILRSWDVPFMFETISDMKMKFGVGPKDWTKMRAIVGDPTDNIPHIRKGVGPKTAALIIASGADPSKKFPPVIQIGNEWLRESWVAIHKNYRLSRIMRTPDDVEMLDEKVHKNLTTIHNRIKNNPECLLKIDNYDEDDAFEWLTKFITKYEMAELFTYRRVLVGI